MLFNISKIFDVYKHQIIKLLINLICDITSSTKFAFQPKAEKSIRRI